MFHSKALTEIGRDHPESVIRLKELVGLDETSIAYPDTLPPQETYEEGSKITTIVNAYERNPEARQKCLEYYRAICRVCDFNFEKVFGEIGRGFIHVHHLKELRDIGKSYHVDPVSDLAPVCPNCHAMLHKRRPAYTIEELKSIIGKNGAVN
jgi:5-methylcytosine-specific restriction enzyme A